MKRSLAAILTCCLLASPLGARAAAPTATHQLLAKLQWRNIGPYNGGRVVAVTGVPSQPNTFYMGSVQGGVWRSTNAGTTWDNITDGKIPGTATSIGAIAVAPSNPKIIYAGTGESDIRGDFDTGVGIYKSTDAGKTWSYAGLKDTHTTMALAIDPHNANVVYASSMGHVFKPNSERGVFKTTDGGKTWKKVLYVDANTGANSLVMDPKDPNVLYATMWQAQRTPWNLTSGGPGSGLYKTVDGGAHWIKISSHPGFAKDVLGKMGVALAPSDPRVVYAIVQAHDGGVFRSNDAGATWTRVNAEMKLRQRAFYYMALTVDPTNPNVAYAPEVDSVWKTKDGGKTWSSLTPPGDHHIIWINPLHTNMMIEGDDGGATVSMDGGKTWSPETTEPIAQFYHIALDDQFPYHVYGAQQDQGAYEGPSASNEGLTQGQWHNVALGESTFVAVDPRDPHTTFGSGYDSSLARLDYSTGEEKNVSPWPLYMSGAASDEEKYRFGWTHPVLFSPAEPNVLFETAQVVFKSSDFGQTWKVISPDLTRNDKRTEGPTGGPVDNDATGVEIFPDIASFAISPLDGSVMWAGSADGLVHVTTDGGTTWNAVTPPALKQWAQISSIEPSHTEKGTAFLTASRFQWDDFHPYVYKTTDYGAHWTAMTNGLPSDQYVFVVREDPRDPRVLVAGTRSTVYVSLDAGSHWQPLTLNLPGVQVRDIAFSARQGQIAIATHGRAFWVLDNLALLEQLAADPHQALFAPERAWLSHAYGSGYTPPNSGENPAYGATVYFDIPSSYNGKTPVTLAFKDASGNVVRSFTLHLRDKKAKPADPDLVAYWPQEKQVAYALAKHTAIDPGANAFQWDMRYAPATEVHGLMIETTDDFSDELKGPTILPGRYTAVLTYGGVAHQQSFDVTLDPRLHPAEGDLAARLALATKLSSSLDRMNRAINVALAARPRLSAAKRAELDALVGTLVQFDVHSSEGDLLHEVELRDHMAFLMNELDLAYQAPTAAEEEIGSELMAQADAAVTKLDALVK
ncbi:MAG: glycosyl hydrolase [bacterium]|nr:glycosyl hydrolase [bacterium]